VSCGRLLEKGNAADIRMPLVHMLDATGERWVGVKTEPGMIQAAHDYIGMILHGPSYTHLDALSHQFWDGMCYNGRPSDVVTVEEGALKGSIHMLRHGIASRGVLLDIADARGVKWLDTREPIYVEDLETAEERAGVRVEEGDILFYRSGYYRQRVEQGPVSLADGRSGFHPECLPWFHERGVALVGGDTANDVIPGLYQRVRLPVHQVGIVAMGMPLIDNANLEELAAACRERQRWEFHLTIAPLPIVYGTASPVNPIATF
jgi:kynurenine formamidase